jgi:hypothetical protein
MKPLIPHILVACLWFSCKMGGMNLFAVPWDNSYHASLLGSGTIDSIVMYIGWLIQGVMPFK